MRKLTSAAALAAASFIAVGGPAGAQEATGVGGRDPRHP